MAADAAQRLIRRYLKDLGEATRGLARAERRELTAQIEEHIRSALPAQPSEAQVRGVLERLGEPGEIVAEQYGLRPQRSGAGTQQVDAVILLLVGGFLAGIGWIVGAVLLWSSRAWTVREKILGTLLVPGGLATAVWVTLATGTEDCGGTVTFSRGVRRTISHCTGATTTLEHMLSIVLFAILVIAPIASAIFLLRRARALPA